MTTPTLATVTTPQPESPCLAPAQTDFRTLTHLHDEPVDLRDLTHLELIAVFWAERRAYLALESEMMQLAEGTHPELIAQTQDIEVE